MGMLHSTSGKSFHELFNAPSKYQIPRDQMKRILIREDILRASNEIQEEYSMRDDLAWFRDVTENLQRRALQEEGVAPSDVAEALITLHNARRVYQSDSEMNQLTVYQRLDRSRAGDLSEGEMCPDAALATLSGEPTSLLAYIATLPTDMPLFIFAGSAS